MMYQVIARRFRPQTFSDVIGQQHITQALINALNANRLHHAYLFTGTRGVGKTSLARLLAKCLNCETGITAEPCRTCSTCQAIEAGNCVDLLEIDAASRTKVEDTRDLLDNVQYLPSSARFKIYLIDEVHMLSNHSFNALLKTLEEPPEHVKFLLATTDPHKLPVTILSRCLQFHLKNLLPEQITEQLSHILQKEKIDFELPAIQQLSLAANGSLRDGLSLLEQAISFSSEAITAANVNAMLGTLPDEHVIAFLMALIQHDANQLLEQCQQLITQTIDFDHALSSLLSLLHYIGLYQLTQTHQHENPVMQQAIADFAKQLSPEDIQLFYQIGLIGRRDLPLAPTPKIGFEMVLLRMLAFKPHDEKIKIIQKTQEPKTPPTQKQAITTDWTSLIQQMNLSGLTQTLAVNCHMNTLTQTQCQLILDPQHKALFNDTQKQRLNNALNKVLGRNIDLTIHIEASNNETPAKQQYRQSNERHKQAVEAIETDSNVEHLLKTFDASIQTDTIQPIEETKSD